MWMMTKYGFFSVVCARRTGDGKYNNPVDPTRMMIRSRSRTHLDKLLKKYGRTLGKPTVREFNGTDYPYRVFVPTELWVEAAAKLAADIDYDNFKDAAKKAGVDKKYLDVLHRIWSLGLSLTEEDKRAEQEDYWDRKTGDVR